MAATSKTLGCNAIRDSFIGCLLTLSELMRIVAHQTISDGLSTDPRPSLCAKHVPLLIKGVSIDNLREISEEKQFIFSTRRIALNHETR